MTLTLVSDAAREWGKAKFKQMQTAKGSRLSHRELAGFIGEAVVREYMERELLLDAAHGPLYGNDLIVEGRGVEAVVPGHTRAAQKTSVAVPSAQRYGAKRWKTRARRRRRSSGPLGTSRMPVAS